MNYPNVFYINIVCKRVNAHPILKSISYLAKTASAKYLFGGPKVFIALFISTVVIAENYALKTLIP